MIRKNLLLIIDPQNDFVSTSGALYVKNADKDMKKLAEFIKKEGNHITDIMVTLDTHHPIHIATPNYWEDKNGNPPQPYTNVTYEDVKNCKWLPRYHKRDALNYLKKLEENGRQHIIWPPHTRYSSSGWAVYDEIYDAVYNWKITTGGSYITYTKGQDSEKTEMFSAVRPEISLNTEKDEANARKFYDYIEGYDSITIGGEAEDFCVKETLQSIMAEKPEIIPTITVLKDCTSAIYPDNPDLATFWNNITKMGLKLESSDSLKLE